MQYLAVLHPYYWPCAYHLYTSQSIHCSNADNTQLGCAPHTSASVSRSIDLSKVLFRHDVSDGDGVTHNNDDWNDDNCHDYDRHLLHNDDG